MSVKTVAYAALISVAALGAASAETLSAGHAQLAAILGVDGSNLTTAELVQLSEAKREGDAQAWNFILSGDNRAQSSEATRAIAAELAARHD